MLTVEAIARICHEANKAYCQVLGDFSQLGWDESPEWQRASAIAGVNFYIKTPGATPQMSHQSWLDHKLVDGWRYGPVKDPELKEHPCMVPYAKLPYEQRRKDQLFINIVSAMNGNHDSND